MEHRIVDLNDVFQLPLSWVQKVAAAQTPRLRLLPPYRELGSQAFARFLCASACSRIFGSISSARSPAQTVRKATR